MSLTKQEADAASTKVQAMARRMFARDVAYAMVAEKWEKIFDPVRARYYYYNVVDDQAIWKRPAPLMWRDLDDVAPTFTDEQAAILVQSAWRRLKFMRVVRRRIAKVFSKVYEEETGTYYYYNAQTGETSWSKPLVLGSQDIDEGRLVGGDGRLLADDRSEVADSDSDASAGAKSDEESVVDGDDSEEDDSRGDSDDASLTGQQKGRSCRASGRGRSPSASWTRRRTTRGATILKLGGLGLPRGRSALSIETLTELDVSDNRLSRLQKDFGGLFNLEVLDVSGNRLRTFPRELQDLDKLRLGALEELDLCENVLVELPMEVGNLALLQETRVWEVGVGLLEELRVLKLRGNKLAKWPNQLDSLKNLETLDLSKNDLAHMAPVRVAQSEEQKTAAVKPGEVAIGAPDPKQCDWAGLASLTRLDISGNRIAAFPADLAKMTALTELDARDNAIKALPKNLAGLRGLVAFPLDGNRLEKLDDALKGLRALKLLSAPRNGLRSLTVEIAQLRFVKQVDLDGNELASLPKEITQLRSCERLTFAKNRLAELPKGFGSMFRLQALVLRSNKFDKIDGDLLASLVSLTELDFSDNAVAVFPKKLCRLGKLTRSTFANKLWFVPKEIRSLGELKFFHLHENRLKTADMSRAEVATLKALEVLTLHDNYLEELPPEFADLPRLRKLTLSHNPCAAEVHAALAPFVDGLRVRATHLSVSAAAFRPPKPADVEDSSAAAGRYRRAATLTGASQGAEKLERGDVAEAVAPLVAAADAHARLVVDEPHAATARREEELRKRAEEEAAAEEEEEDDDDDDAPKFVAAAPSAAELDFDLGEEKSPLHRDPPDAATAELLLEAKKALDAAEHLDLTHRRADAAAAKRLLLTERGLKMPEPDEQAPRAVAEVLDELELNDISREVERGLDALHLLGVDDKNMHRVYDVSPQGILGRRKSELKDLETTGRSKQRAILEMRKRKHDSYVRDMKEMYAVEEADMRSAKNLADKVHADLAFRAAKYQLERDEEDRLRRIEAARLLEEERLVEADRCLAMEGVERAWMADEDPQAAAEARARKDAAKPAKKKRHRFAGARLSRREDGADE
ncbi:hypothetical protein JL722_14537 [Aureococcus anophagefferens]|nr:hypothetical protein JL722_14537 [Aureococcus anophagefferens]